MSDIKVGDLVMIVRGHECSVKKAGGIPFIVTSLIDCVFYCNKCKCDISDGIGVTGYIDRFVPVSWLIRIDPPAIPESINEQEKVSA